MSVGKMRDSIDLWKKEIKDQIAIDRLKDAEAFITDVEDYLKKEGWIN